MFENWESEFLQMAAFVLMTVALRQKGSSESKPLDEEGRRARGADPVEKRALPRPARRLAPQLYENSLSIALFLLFVVSFSLHAIGGAAEENRERLLHGEARVSAFGVCRLLEVLVRIVPELAERVSLRRRF